jgi:hypothetical protein
MHIESPVEGLPAAPSDHAGPCCRSAAGRAVFAAAAILSAALAVAAPDAQALIQRTYVASTGADTGPCNLPQPCRTFNAAIANTLPGGEVIILDTAGYGPMVITKAIKIIGPAGVYGGISVQGGVNPTTGILINAGNGDDITLRGLDIASVPGAAPLPLIGIDIQNAGGVHIEKTSVSGFSEEAGSCIQLNTAGTVRVYVDDSFLRGCRNGILADGNTLVANQSSVVVDNTRIERGRGPTQTTGIWLRNHMSLALRNSHLSRLNYGVKADTTVDGVSTELNVVNSLLTRIDHAITINKTANNAFSRLTLTGSHVGSALDGVFYTNSGNGSGAHLSMIDTEIVGAGNAVAVTNSGTGTNATNLRIQGGQISSASGNGIVLANSAADANSRLNVDIIRAMMTNITNPMVDASAANGGRVNVDVDGSTFANTGASVFRTSGTSAIVLNVAHSHVHNCTTVLDHGNAAALVRFDGSHLTSCTNDFVNSGGTEVKTFGNNSIDIANTGGLTYITPTVVTLK